MSSTVAVLLLVAILGVIIILFWRQNKVFNDLGDFYKKNNFVFRQSSPVENPFVYTDVTLTCNDGMLKSGVPYTLILGTRLVTDGQGTSGHRYIGVYLPHQVQVSDERLNTWKQKVAERGDNWAQHSGVQAAKKDWGVMGPPEHLPIRAVRVNNGVFIGWSGLHLRKTIEARLSEIIASL